MLGFLFITFLFLFVLELVVCCLGGEEVWMSISEELDEALCRVISWAIPLTVLGCLVSFIGLLLEHVIEISKVNL